VLFRVSGLASRPGKPGSGHEQLLEVEHQVGGQVSRSNTLQQEVSLDVGQDERAADDR